MALWIEFHPDELLDMQKFQDFRVKMSWTENETLGFLGRFWGKVLKLRESGDISGWRPDYVARLTDAKAHPDTLWKAMDGVWLDDDGAGKVLVHDWLMYAATYLRGRYKTRQKERLVAIWALHGKVYGGGDAPEDPKEAGSNREVRGKERGSPPTDRTGPDQTIPTGPAANGDSSSDDGRPDGGPGVHEGRAHLSMIEATLLSKPWHFKGDHHLKRTGDLPPEYCKWALRNLQKLSPEERMALDIVIRRASAKVAL